jgi:AraC-like DNA-binding protein
MADYRRFGSWTGDGSAIRPGRHVARHNGGSDGKTWIAHGSGRRGGRDLRRRFPGLLDAMPSRRLTGQLAVSPTHLSRTFRHETGSSLTRYRNRLRVSHALDRIEGGEDNLAVLAADLGFADQAHFIRTMREHTGHTPGKLRAVLHQLAD